MSQSSSLPKQPYSDFEPSSPAVDPQTPAWKQEVNQRLAAHRTRRGGPSESNAPTGEESPRAASKRAADAAARVAARYAKAPSYSDVLASEARAAVRAAGAAADAARTAHAAAQAVLAGLESVPEPTLWDQPAAYVQTAAPVAAQAAPPRWQDEAPVAAPAPPPANPWAGAQPRWQETLPAPTPGGRDVWSEMRLHPSVDASQQSAYTAGTPKASRMDESDLLPYSAHSQHQQGLDAYDAVGSATVEPVQHIPANLIEFPREIVAPRKARPRLAEGAHFDASQESPQLSIFEVDPDQLAPPIVLGDTGRESVAPPVWASIELDHHQTDAHHDAVYSQHSFVDHLTLQAAQAAEQGRAYVETAPEVRPAPAPRPAYINAVQTRYDRLAEAHSARASQTAQATATAELVIAPLSDRILAAVVDGALVMLAFLAAAVLVIASSNHPPSGKIGILAGICGYVLFGLLYQFLFFSYAEEGTPGMRYARVALCTFTDDNPTREQMRMRIPAFLVATLPAGLGLLWALVDGDHLALHDRLTRTYQRKY